MDNFWLILGDIPFLFTGKLLSSVLGWVGSISYLLAYFLLTINKLKSNHKLYHLLNVIGAIGLTYHGLFLSDYPNVIVNVAWAVIGISTIFFLWTRKQD